MVNDSFGAELSHIPMRVLLFLRKNNYEHDEMATANIDRARPKSEQGKWINIIVEIRQRHLRHLSGNRDGEPRCSAEREMNVNNIFFFKRVCY